MSSLKFVVPAASCAHVNLPRMSSRERVERAVSRRGRKAKAYMTNTLTTTLEEQLAAEKRRNERLAHINVANQIELTGLRSELADNIKKVDILEAAAAAKTFEEKLETNSKDAEIAALKDLLEQHGFIQRPTARY